MNTVTSRELKNHTGAILKRVRRGERITVTNRGRPIAVVLPYDEAAEGQGELVRPYEPAWQEIEAALESSEPEYPTWQEAVRRSRKRR